MFDDFKKYFRKAAVNYGISRELEAAQVCRCFRRVREEMWKGAEDYLDAESFKSGVLKLTARGAAWSQELNMKRLKILKRINEELGKRVVEDVFVRII